MKKVVKNSFKFIVSWVIVVTAIISTISPISVYAEEDLEIQVCEGVHKHGRVCDVCNETITPGHIYNDEYVCTICGEACDHSFVIGECIKCGYRCTHNDAETIPESGCEICGAINPNKKTLIFDASTSGVNVSESPDKLIDGQTNTKWCKGNIDKTNGEYIIFHIESAEIPVGYNLITANDISTYKNRNWKNWTIYVSNRDVVDSWKDSDYSKDDDLWHVVDSKVDYTALPYENFKATHFNIDYNIDNCNSYNYYMVKIFDVISDSMMQMGEFELLTVPVCEEHDALDGICRRCGTVIHSHKDNLTKKNAKAPTCVKNGYIDYYVCNVCNNKYLDADCTNLITKSSEYSIAKTGIHDYKTVTTKATLTENGKKETKCSSCGDVSKTTTIYAAKDVSISATSYTYDGKVKTPTVTVKDSRGKDIAASNYTVTYSSGRTNVGTYYVKVTFKGNYSGSKKMAFKINPPKTAITSITPGTNAMKVAWNKQAKQVTGYQIQYSTKSDFSVKKTVTVDSYTTVTKTIKELKSKTKYYVRIRTFKDVKDERYYSSWSSKKTLTTK